jgi:hypothetical protein
MDSQSVVVYLSLKALNLATSKAGSHVIRSKDSINLCRRLM